ncbi:MULTISPECIES: CTP synthase C-terminal region-related (seleno)protein [Gammaproteobacteria]|uniref:CTP synthase (glutamine hydrolyzing) n=1 Tax=Pseudomonas lini TaxID=163011 RepID=A0A423IES2_9PSED|nr:MULTISPECIES: CTP synthase [Gammaproteobacteria]MBK5300110.1 CTP synthase [Bacillus sp. TH86]MBK5319879.1 CTP synthase [Bacillus sp. TH59]MBK5334829.1 CTP synthase [Bacillus sp. TH57]MBK5308918.1 CTP synthase [Pseudomonas sp. TH71]MBK5314378.1 CTP synthase [Erwinia sp. TH79]
METNAIRIALIGDHDPQVTAHQAIPVALGMAAEHSGRDIQFQWLATDTINADTPLNDFDGFWCVPASPYRDMNGALRAIRFAREQQRPFLGTCGGFQHAVLEFARNVLGWEDAEHGETSPDATRALLTPLTCSLVEAVDSIHLVEGSLIAEAYENAEIREGYHCRYGVNPEFERELLKQQLHAVGHDSAGDLRAVELKDHPFFVATLFQPERAALKGILPPLVRALIEACARQKS